MKQSKILISVAIALALGAGFYIYTIFYPNPLKVTDPDSPLFNPMQYEGRYYRDNPELAAKALKKAMPQGTPLETISIIMKNNDSCFKEGKSKEFPGMVNFICESSLKYLGGQNRIFWFDENDRLIDYFGSGTKGIYTGKFPEEIWSLKQNEQR